MNSPRTYATLATAAWLLIEPPEVTAGTRCLAVAPGECLQVTVTGHGQDVVLIPGLFGSAFSFRHVIPRLDAAGYPRSGNSSWVTDDVVASYAAGPTRDLQGTLEAFAQMARAREPEALASRLAQVRCPVHLVLGAAPHTGGPSEAEVALLHRALPSFSVERVPGAGHFLFEETPDVVVSAVARMAGK